MGKRSENRSRLLATGFALALVAFVVLAFLLGRGEFAGDREPWSGPVPEEEGRSPIPLNPAAATDPASVPLPDERVCVTGLVLSAETGDPVPGARVRIDTEWGDLLPPLDARGAWSVELPPTLARPHPLHGSLLHFPDIHAEAPGHVAVRTRIRVLPGLTEMEAPTIHLRRAGALLSGVVVDPSGNPVPGARIEVRARKHGVPSGPRHTTDAAGRFGPIPVHPGPLPVIARADEFAYGERRIVAWASIPPREIEVEIVLAAPTFAEGRVHDETGQPVAGAVVRPQMREWPSVSTDAKGRFRWVLRDRNEVIVEKEGFTDPKRLHEIVQGGLTEIVIHREAALEGVVRNEDGSPAADVELSASHETGGYSAFARTAADGSFRLGGIRPGKNRVIAYRAQVPLGAFDFPLLGPGTRRDVVLRLTGLERFEGSVLDALTRAPIEGARLLPHGDASRAPLAVSDADGKFVFGYSLKPHGKWFAGAWFVKEDYLPAQVGPKSAAVELSPVGRVTALVLDDRGRPAPGARAEWSRKRWPFFRKKTAFADAEGRLEVDLPAGEAVLVSLRHPLGTAGFTATAEPGRTRDLGTVVLRRGGSGPSFVVRDAAGRAIPGAMLEAGGWHGTIHHGDEDGRIRFAAASGGTAVLSAPGMVRRKVDLGKLSRDGEVVLHPAAQIRGRVVDSAGFPVAAAEVTAGFAETVTDGRGAFVLDGLEKGLASLVSVGDGPQRFPGPWWGRIAAAWAVAGGADLTLVAPLLARLRFEVAGEPPEGSPERTLTVNVHVLDREDLEEGGPFRNEWEAEMEDDSLVLEVPSGRLRVAFRIGEGVERIRQIEAAPGREFVLVCDAPAPGTLTGTVTDGDGRPVEDAILFDPLTDRHFARTGEGGRIQRIPGEAIPRGTLRVGVGAEGFAGAITRPLDLAAGADVHLRLERGGRLEGRVRDARLNPVRGKVRLRSAFGRHGDWKKVHVDGRFEFRRRVPSGSHVLELLVPGRLPDLRRVEVVDGRTTEMRIVIDD